MDEFVDVEPVAGQRVGLIGRGGLVARALVAEVVGDDQVLLRVDGSSRRLRFARDRGAWTHRGLARNPFVGVRFVAEPAPEVERAPLRRNVRGGRGR